MKANADVYIRGHLGLFNVVIFAISLLAYPLLALVQCALWGFLMAEFMGYTNAELVYHIVMQPTYWMNIAHLWEGLLVIVVVLLVFQPRCTSSRFMVSALHSLQTIVKLVVYFFFYALLVTYTGGIFLAIQCAYHSPVKMAGPALGNFEQFCSRQTVCLSTSDALHTDSLWNATGVGEECLTSWQLAGDHPNESSGYRDQYWFTLLFVLWLTLAAFSVLCHLLDAHARPGGKTFNLTTLLMESILPIPPLMATALPTAWRIIVACSTEEGTRMFLNREVFYTPF